MLKGTGTAIGAIVYAIILGVIVVALPPVGGLFAGWVGGSILFGLLMANMIRLADQKG